MYVRPSDIQVPLPTADTTYKGIFLKMMFGVMEQQFDSELPLIGKEVPIDDSPENWNGTYAEFAVDLERLGDAFVSRDDGPIPEGEFTVPKLGRLSEVVVGVPFHFTEGLAWSQGGGKDVQLVKPFAYLLKKKLDDLKDLFLRMLYTDSEATLGTVTSEASGVITLTEGQNKQFLNRMKVENWTVTGAAGSEVWASHKGDVYIVALGLNAPTVSVSGTRDGVVGAGYSFAFAAGDRLVLKGAAVAGATVAGSSLNGLDEIIDDGTIRTIFEGISRDQWQEWQALRMLAAPTGTGSLTTRLMHNFIMGQRQVGTGKPSLLLVDPGVMVEGFELFQPAVEYAPGGTATGGFRKLMFQSGDIEVELRRDFAMTRGRMMLLSPETLKLLRKERLGWRPWGYTETGQPVRSPVQFVSDPKRYRASGSLRMVLNLACTRCSGNAQLGAITTQDVIYPRY